MLRRVNGVRREMHSSVSVRSRNRVSDRSGARVASTTPVWWTNWNPFCASGRSYIKSIGEPPVGTMRSVRNIPKKPVEGWIVSTTR